VGHAIDYHNPPLLLKLKTFNVFMTLFLNESNKKELNWVFEKREREEPKCF
jgi:hypothetical protein